MKEENYQLLNDYLLTLDKISSLEEMDEFINKISNAVMDTYPCISCRSGCYTCCTGAGLPVVYPKEWQRIRDYLKNMPEEKKQIISEQMQKFYENQSPILHFLHWNIGKPMNSKNFNSIADIFKEEACPLLINGRCSVYSVRPTACRTFGAFFRSSVNKEIEPLTCRSDTEKMSDYFSNNNINHPNSPLEIKVREKLINFVQDDSEIYNRTMIPIWLQSDIELSNIELNTDDSINSVFNYVKKLYSFELYEELEKFCHLFSQKSSENSKKLEVFIGNLKLEKNNFVGLDKTKQMIKEKAFKNFTKRNYLKAEKEFLKLCKLDETNGEFFYYLGISQLKQEKFNDAIDSFTQSLKLGKYKTDIFYFLADCLMQIGDKKMADLFYNKAKEVQQY